METFNTDETVPYTICVYRGGKIPGKCNRGFTERKSEKCRKAFMVFKGTICINEVLDHVLEFKGEAKVNNNRLF